MTFVTIEEAQSGLPELIGRLLPGEECRITKNGLPVATLVALPPVRTEPRQLGTLRGTVIHMSDDFDDPL